MARSKIEWLARPGTVPESWNVITGCTKISEGCLNCYAERMSKRLAGRFGYPEAPHQFDVTLHPDKLDEPLHWLKSRTVFVCSMGDLFHVDVPFEWIDRVWRRMDATPQHTYMVLTKRPERLLEYWIYREHRSRADGIPFRNVWLGVTAENQRRADERIPLLLQCPAAVRFVSVEPMLGPITFGIPSTADGSGYWRDALVVDDSCTGERHLDWVILGGETGPGARPMHPDWARGVRDQCVTAGVPFFFKSHGAYLHESQGGISLPAHMWSDGTLSSKVSSKHSSHLLDGQEWHQWPL